MNVGLVISRAIGLLVRRMVGSSPERLVQTRTGAAQSILTGAGWSPGRRVAVEGYLEAMAREGYEPTVQLEEFLAEYGGLSTSRPAAQGFVEEVFATDPVTAISNTHRNTVGMYEAVTSTALVPIGQAYNGHMVLMMAPDGRFYAGYDSFFFYAGDGAVEMFARLFSGPLDRIPIPDE
ncbi:SUKH-3 domain-containing protein [Kribbella qitaiheensis]|uniref:SUKH-3 domain-containing protein n=1 Tax=Kribbella qitaiheensis TaxID=1544730 RepID=UPI00162AB89F|nr:SUKH-3 domain-containing protein [Kribbella qitaiheensis]